MKKVLLTINLIAFICATALTVTAQDLAQNNLILQNHCTTCHGLDKVTEKRRQASEWKAVLERMINYGLEIGPEDEMSILDYLKTNYVK